MSTDLKSNGRIPDVTACHAATNGNAVAAEGRYPTSLTADALLDRRAVCELLGGSKPINASTLYRGIRQGRFPRPIRVGGSSRWLRDECEAVLRGMVEARQ
jgi:predicted DNA-binding transcriptional regulator AlpA